MTTAMAIGAYQVAQDCSGLSDDHLAGVTEIVGGRQLMGTDAKVCSLSNKRQGQRWHGHVGVQLARQACTKVGADCRGVEGLNVCKELLACDTRQGTQVRHAAG